VGGHCIAVDPWFIVDSAPKESRIIRVAREVNDGKPHRVVESIRSAARKSKKAVVACLGLAFKADIDDLRESPAVEIVRELAKDKKLSLLVVEPHVQKLPPALLGLKNVELCEAEEALKRSSVAVLLVNHRVFLNLNRKLLKGKMLIDTRGGWR
jgi:UDP-N-acetyl-D-mannosaminuronic acid dehydrogenase